MSGLLTIRDVQRAALEQPALEAFTNLMCKHVSQYFPHLAAQYDAAGLRGHVQAALRRAAGYDFRSPRDACRFLNLTAQYGWEFDRDEQYGWMRAYLTRSDIDASSARLDLIISQCRRQEAMSLEMQAQRDAFAAASASFEFPVQRQVAAAVGLMPDDASLVLLGAAEWLAEQLCVPLPGDSPT